MAKFNVGDVVKKSPNANEFKIVEVDELCDPLYRYKLSDGDSLCFWDYCLGWQKVVQADEVQRYGKILTDDIINYSDCHRIKTIAYDDRIYYIHMKNGKIVIFKCLSTEAMNCEKEEKK